MAATPWKRKFTTYQMRSVSIDDLPVWHWFLQYVTDTGDIKRGARLFMEHSSLAAIQSKTSSICSIEVNHLQAKLIRMMKVTTADSITIRSTWNCKFEIYFRTVCRSRLSFVGCRADQRCWGTQEEQEYGFIYRQKRNKRTI